MFLAADIAAIAKLGEITPANTVEFTDLVCEALMYRLKSSAGQGKRKEKASTAALAAADLLKFVIDSRFRSESIGLNEIKAAVQSIDPQVRRNINLTRLCSSIYEVNDQAPIATIPGPQAVGLPGNVPMQPYHGFRELSSTSTPRLPRYNVSWHGFCIRFRLRVSVSATYNG